MSGFHSQESCSVDHKRLRLVNAVQITKMKITHMLPHPPSILQLCLMAESKQRGAVKAVSGRIPGNLGVAPKTENVLQ